MADYLIKRFADVSVEVCLRINDIAITNTDYTIRCKMRNRTKVDHSEPFVSVNGTFLEFTVTNSLTDLDRVFITLTDVQTGTLTATGCVTDDRLPLLDFELDRTSDGYRFHTVSQTVSVVESQAQDE